jgi:hypothetical protein
MATEFGGFCSSVLVMAALELHLLLPHLVFQPIWECGDLNFFQLL